MSQLLLQAQGREEEHSDESDDETEQHFSDNVEKDNVSTVEPDNNLRK